MSAATQLTAPRLRLYEVADQYRTILEAIAEAGGELDSTLEQAFDEITGGMEERVGACIKVLREHQLDAEAYKAEANRLNGLAQAASNKAENLKAYIKYCLERAGENMVKTPIATARLQNSPPSARWEREVDQIPTHYQRVAITFNATAALADHKAGLPLPDGIEIRQGKHLVIR